MASHWAIVVTQAGQSLPNHIFTINGNTMDPVLNQPINLKDEPKKLSSLTVQSLSWIIHEDSKLADDAIRIDHQFQTHTEESVAAGSPENLL